MRYEPASLFFVRMSGVPFDLLEAFSTPDLAHKARAIIAAEAALDTEAVALLERLEGELPAGKGDNDTKALHKTYSWLRKRARKRDSVDKRALAGLTDDYQRAFDAVTVARAELAEVVPARVQAAYQELLATAREVLPEFVVLGAPKMLDVLRQCQSDPVRAQNRRKVSSIASYMQRLCGKSETFGKFGPCGVGRIVDGGPAMSLAPEPGVSQSKVLVERCVVEALLRVLNQDPAVRPQLCPRRNGFGRVCGDVFVNHASGARTDLGGEDLAVLERIDGQTPAHELGDLDRLERLADSSVIIWELEHRVPCSDPMRVLRDQIAGWKDEKVVARWLPLADRILQRAEDYRRAAEPADRLELLRAITSEVEEVGGAIRERSAGLYEATNVLVEECYHECNLELGRAPLQEFIDRASPWFDLLRDTMSLGAKYAYPELSAALQAHSGVNGEKTLASFTAALTARGESVSGISIRSGRRARDVLNEALKERWKDRERAEEWVITAEDLAVLRNTIEFPIIDRFRDLSVDLMPGAPSLEDHNAGRRRMVIGEVHGIFGSFQNSLFMWCPDRDEMQRIADHHRGNEPFLRVDPGLLPVHIDAEALFRSLNANYVDGQPPVAGRRCFDPARVLVVDRQEERDIRCVDASSGEDLGSLVRDPVMFFGMHPFFPIHLEGETPRLTLNDVVVQRRTLDILEDEVEGQFEGLSAERLVAVEKLRMRHNLPRFVYIRPLNLAGRSYRDQGRVKDRKPILVDLESYIFVELFYKQLKRYGGLSVVEMLPAADELLWRELDGRRTFELRINLMSEHVPTP